MSGEGDSRDGDAIERELEEAARGLDAALAQLRRATRSGVIDKQAARQALDEAERQLQRARARMDAAEAAWRASQRKGEPKT